MVLTKEEKLAKKEAKKQEKLRQEAELRRILKCNELQRELAAYSRRRDSVEKKWRDIMLKIKEPVFRQEITVLWQTFERAFDKKDNIIKYTMKLMGIADDQFQRCVAAFCDTIDTMINKFLSELDELSEENHLRTTALLKRGDDEATNIMKDHDAAETHLQLLLYHGHTTADSMAWTARGENLVKQDEDRNKFLDDRENLRSYLEDVYNATWDQYKAVLKAYIVDTAENQKQVRVLRRKESMMADIIASQGKKIANSDGLLKKLRTELAAYESGTKQAVFRDRRNRHRDACSRLKQNMYNGVDTDMSQLARLVRVSDDAVEWLEAAYKKVEKILRMAALCRKFETRREKVLPFSSCMPHSPAQSRASTRRQQSDDPLVVNAIAATSGLTRLWHRISKAELTKRALCHEKALLERENEFLLNRFQDLDSGSKEMTPDTYECICGKDKIQVILPAPTAEAEKATQVSIRRSSKDITRPVAVEAALEASKFNLQAPMH